MLSPELALFLQADENKNLLREPACVAGIIFAISASPDIPMPEKWMPWTLSEKASKISAQKADLLADALMGQLRWQLDIMRKNKKLLPSECTWHKQKQLRVNLEAWLSGVLFAHKECETSWQQAWQHKQIDEGAARLTRILKCVSILADSDAALASSPIEKQTTLAENLPVLANQLTHLLEDYVALAGELAPGLPGQFETVKS